jgi:hypothetical protein
MPQVVELTQTEVGRDRMPSNTDFSTVRCKLRTKQNTHKASEANGQPSYEHKLYTLRELHKLNRYCGVGEDGGGGVAKEVSDKPGGFCDEGQGAGGVGGEDGGVGGASETLLLMAYFNGVHHCEPACMVGNVFWTRVTHSVA